MMNQRSKRSSGCGRDVISSNDAVEDKLECEQFIQKYREMHRLVRNLKDAPCFTLAQKTGRSQFRWPLRVARVLRCRCLQAGDFVLKNWRERNYLESRSSRSYVAPKNDNVKAESEDPITRLQELVSDGAANT